MLQAGIKLKYLKNNNFLQTFYISSEQQTNVMTLSNLK